MPISTKEVFNLNSVSGGLHADTLSLHNIDMQGDNAVTIRDTANGSGSLVILDLSSLTDMRLPMKEVDSATMNPTSRILALRSNLQIQIYNLDRKIRIKTANVSESVVYWAWISGNILAIVTVSSVYHWDIHTPGDPTLMFRRDSAMADLHILGYTVASNSQFGALTAVRRLATGVSGVTQLYSFRTSTYLMFEGLKYCFISSPHSTEQLCGVCTKTDVGGDLIIYALSDSHAFRAKKAKTFSVSFDERDDFPVFIRQLPKRSVLEVLTRNGLLLLVDVTSGDILQREKVSNSIIFTAIQSEIGDIHYVNATGSVSRIDVSLDTASQGTISLTSADEPFSPVARKSVPENKVDSLEELQGLLDRQQIDAAVKLVSSTPNHRLRTNQTILKFTACGHSHPNIQPPPISTYYKHLLSLGKLNEAEAAEFARAVVARGGFDMLRKLLADDKLEVSGDLGRIIAVHDEELAMRVLHKAQEHEEVVRLLLTRGDFGKVSAYCNRVQHSPAWADILRECVAKKLDVSVQVAVHMHKQPDHSGIEPMELVNLFMESQCIKQLTLYLLEILQGDRPEDGELQTKLLEVNLRHSPPKVAEQIFLQNLVSHYDALFIAPLCEKAGLYRWAIDCYTKGSRDQGAQTPILSDLRRCMQKIDQPSADWLSSFFGELSREDGLCLLEDLVAADPEGSYKVTVQIAAKYHSILEIKPIVEILVKHGAHKSVFFFVETVKDLTTDPEVHFQYLASALVLGEIKELEKITREDAFYDPLRAKVLLLESAIEDPRPLINICDKHCYTRDLVTHFIQRGKFNLVEQYVQKYSPKRSPDVIGVLFELNHDEDAIKGLIESVGSLCSSQEMISVTEKANRIGILQPWLERKVKEKSKDPVVHNTLAKIYITQGKAEEFLANNDYYDPQVIGNYCENREPAIAFHAYSKGNCDQEVLDLSFANGLYKDLAKYLVRRQEADLWGRALSHDNRSPLIDAVVQSALPESKSAEAVSIAVKSFMKAELNADLINLLEKLVMHGKKEFRQNKYLQNLLIMTTIKAKDKKALDFIDQLNSFEPREIARAARANEQYEAAFAAFSKSGEFASDAALVLVKDIHSLERCHAYAEKVKLPQVWTILGETYLAERDLSAAVDAFVLAENTDFLDKVAAAAEEAGEHQQLRKYIAMTRTLKKQLSPQLEGDILYSLSRIGDIAELRSFAESAQKADIHAIAARCRSEKLYQAVCVLFQHCNDINSLALTYVEMGDLREAVEVAQKSTSLAVWHSLLDKCLDAKELELANRCAAQLLQDADELGTIVDRFVEENLVDEIIQVLQNALGGEKAHMGIYTELGMLYVKYYPDKALDYVKMHHKRVNKHKLIMQCTQLGLWEVSCFLYHISEEWDSVASLILAEPAFTWEHEMLANILCKVTSGRILDKAVEFYMEYQPGLINELLTAVRNNIDFDQVMRTIKKSPLALLAKPFVETLSTKDIPSVNALLIDIYLAESDVDSLSSLLESNTRLPHHEIGTRLIGHTDSAIRLLGAKLMARHNEFSPAINVYKQEKLYVELASVAARSRNAIIVGEVMDWFITEGRRECFAAVSFLSVGFLPTEVVLEKAFLYSELELLMPHVIQSVSEIRKGISVLRGQQCQNNLPLSHSAKSSQLLLQ